TVFSHIPPRPPHPTLFPYTTLFRSFRCHPRPRTGSAQRFSRRTHGRSCSHRPRPPCSLASWPPRSRPCFRSPWASPPATLADRRSEEHTSELQSRGHLVCRLLLEKK